MEVRFDPEDVVLNYNHDVYAQPVSGVVESGTLIDDDGDDLQIESVTVELYLVEEVIEKYAYEIDRIIVAGTAGDSTWEGLLHAFYEEIRKVEES